LLHLKNVFEDVYPVPLNNEFFIQLSTLVPHEEDIQTDVLFLYAENHSLGEWF